jgi:transcription antitermination factor NusG
MAYRQRCVKGVSGTVQIRTPPAQDVDKSVKTVYLDSLNSVELPESAWYALYTRHQHEKAVARVLSGKGFQVFLPLYDAVRRWKDRTKQISLPLFPCYVFLQGVHRRLDILSTPGVHSVVSSEGRPAPISEEEIEAIRRMIESKALIEPHPFLKTGDWIRVKAGPLAGVEGILVRKKNQWRLVVSVELLQKSVAVEVDASSVERAPRRSPTSTSGAIAGTALDFP